MHFNPMSSRRVGIGASGARQRQRIFDYWVPLAILILVALLSVGCAVLSESYKKAERAAASDNWDAAVAYYQTALDDNPKSVDIQIKLTRAKANASAQHRVMARRLRAAGDLQMAVYEYQLAVQLNPSDQVAENELRQTQSELAELMAVPVGETRLERIVREADETVLQLPVLRPATETLLLKFESSPIKAIYRSVARAAGLNVVFDPELQDSTVSFDLDNEMPFQEALDLLAKTNGHMVKAISAETFIVAPASKLDQYEDRLIRTFFLSNAQVAEVAQLLRTVIGGDTIAENTSTNSITVRDNPENLALAARLIATADKPLGEVLVEIEILEVDRRSLREYGISLSNSPYEVTQSLAQGEGGISLDQLRNLNATDWFFTIPSIRYKLFKETGDFKLVADPQLRVIENQPASLLIGQEVPIVITQFSPTQFVGSQIVPIQTTEYRNVGIQLDVGARVHHNNEVTLDLNIGISSISAQLGVQDLPIFITRQVNSVTRLGDGETTILAGLLRDDERVGIVGIPGLSSIPILGKLFSSTRREIEQVDVIMTITPHILRIPEINPSDVNPFYLGREIDLGEGVMTRMRVQAPRGTVPVQETATREALGGEQPAAAAATESAATAPDAEVEPEVLTAPPQPVEGILTLTASQAQVRVGEEVIVELGIQAGEDITSIGVRLAFDPQVLRFVGAQEAEFMSRDGSMTAFDARRVGVDGVALAVTRMGSGSGMSGEGRVIRMAFRAVGAGQSSIEFETVTVRGPEEAQLQVEFRPVVVGVSQ